MFAERTPPVPSPSTAEPNPRIVGDPGPFSAELRPLESTPGIYLFRLTLTAKNAPQGPGSIRLEWQFPDLNVKGVWTPGSLYEKRLRADWEADDLEGRVSVNSPVVCLFGHADENRTTVAVSDTVNTVKIATPVREEDQLIYCSVELFSETVEPAESFEVDLRIDTRSVHFSRAISEVSDWWDNQLKDLHAPVPAAATDPVYSTWYAYHQEIAPDELLRECVIAKEMGYGTIIVDDGWQTLDNQRGYAYTGDWEAERFTEMRAFVDRVHDLGMKAMIWYSVPFCGPKSRAYQRFKGKFLTENHRWAPVFDPRYPEVRAYLVGKYEGALREWKLDGLKLDFIDDFRVYPETPAGRENGRDYASVNAGVQQLIMDIAERLHRVNPEVLIEFRQRYVGPELKRVGNMFRAFDCPLDSATNRLRTTDVKMLAGKARVHSDMFIYHPEEDVEVSALQFNNILFSVPQVSVRLAEQSDDQLAMIAFFTRYYRENRDVLMKGEFRPLAPLENYPILMAKGEKKTIVGLYANRVVDLSEKVPAVDIVNGKLSERVVIDCSEDWGLRELVTHSCTGEVTGRESRRLTAGLHRIVVPPSGILAIRGVDGH